MPTLNKQPSQQQRRRRRLRLGQSPKLFRIDNFATDLEVEHILSVAADLPSLNRREIETRHSEYGFSFEMPVAGDEILESMCRRIYELVGMENDRGDTLRFRRYRVGEWHPLHLDTYKIDESNLVATAMLYLTDTAEGGETHFPGAQPAPLLIKPRKGRLVVWFNHQPDGQEDPTSAHQSLPVKRGEKATLTNFIYKPLEHAMTTLTSELSKKAETFEDRAGAKETAAPAQAAGVELPSNSEGQPARARFCCVNDRVPQETVDLLRKACEERRVEYLEIDARTFDYDPARRLKRGDLLYRPAVSLAATRVEQFLFADGVSTFHAEPDGVFYECLNPTLFHERAGLPIPPTVYCSTTNRSLLESYVERLGGLPVVVKILGAAGGLGVMRADSFPALFSLIDYVRAQGHNPLLSTYIDRAVHWRLIVVGDRIAAGYRNLTDANDFRTYAGKDLSDYNAPLSEEMADIAIRAVRSLKKEFGGVDILENEDGQLFLLEANFPCYYPQAQLVAGTDIAGMMINYLLEKAEQLSNRIGLNIN